MDIAEFLTARYDEAQARAEACAQPGPWQARFDPSGNHASSAGEWEIIGVSAGGTSYEVVGSGWEGGGVWQQADAEFIAANSPAVVLADVASKRAIVEGYQSAVTQAAAGGLAKRAFAFLLVQAMRLVLRDLAAPYAEHPDYDPAWTTG